MYQQIYYIDKSTDTFADPLAAYGLATILKNLMPEEAEADIRIKDNGPYYSIELEEPLQPEWVEQATYFSPVDFILTKKMKDRGDYPKDINLADYEAHKRRNAEFYEARKLLRKEALRPGATPDEFPELLSLTPPHPYWEIWAQVNQMSAISAYDGMVAAWYESKPCFAGVIELILQMCATTPNDVEGVTAKWKKMAKAHDLSGKAEAAATQVYNPSTGKGANRPKADNLTIGGQSNFWLLEYLKLVGMQYAGLPRVVSGAKDRKTYVLLPKNIKLSTSNKVFKEFQKVLWRNSAIKMDIVAALKYAQTFLKQWLEGQLTELDLLLGAQPDNYVQGLAMAYYKDMGNALAVLNQSTINLPRWTDRVTTAGEAQTLLNILAEHEAVIQTLREDRGSEYDLLRRYRDFLSSGDLRDFFEFTAAYSSYVTNKIENKEYVNLFTTTNLEALMKSRNKELSPILENAGFQHVAHAIRQSTVNAQWAKIRNQRLYEVRYGLGQELKRKANYNDEFVQALTDFMQSYNQENVQMAERYDGNPPRRRTQLTTEDIAQVIALVDEYGAKTVGNMLIAFGYASQPREEKTIESQES
jgi:hypothetical protein